MQKTIKARIINRGYRLAYRIAFPLARIVWRYYRHDGVMVAVWVGERLLVVRHSYKPGLSIPGGGIKRGEDHRLSAIRELWEEVHIMLDANALIPILSKRIGRDRGLCHVFEIYLDAEPTLTIDGREIIFAAFLSPTEIMMSGCDKYFINYLNAQKVRARGLFKRTEVDPMEDQQIVAIAGSNSA